MNVAASFDNAGALSLSPDYIDTGSAYSVSVTIVPTPGAGWTVTGVTSDPAKTWTNNTATLEEGGYNITVNTSTSGQTGTSAIRISRGSGDPPDHP